MFVLTNEELLAVSGGARANGGDGARGGRGGRGGDAAGGFSDVAVLVGGITNNQANTNAGTGAVGGAGGVGGKGGTATATSI